MEGLAVLAGWPAELQQHVHLVTADVTVSMSLRSAPNCHLMQSAQMQLVFDTHTHTRTTSLVAQSSCKN